MIPAGPAAPTRRRLGEAAEGWAATHLAGRGRRIIARNWACRGGELDIVAWHGPVLTFVEVRARSHAACGHPLESVDAGKRRRLAVAARHFLAAGIAGRWPAQMRFDVLAVWVGPPMTATLVEAAFVCGE